ncbi:helix-turn-helix transcriptional regulator [Tistrella bauzanensis]
MILQRLLDVLLVEALRWRDVVDDDVPTGLLRAMRDPALARAWCHAWRCPGRLGGRRPGEIAGQSRSAFAARFADTLSCGPIEYLARWRMALAKDALMRGTKTLDQIACEIGYDSASAFSTAFRKRQGCPPGQFARISAAAVPV